MKKMHRSNVFFAILTVMTLSVGIYGCDQPSDQPISYPDPPNPTVLDEPGEYKVEKLHSEFTNDFGTYNATIYYPKDRSEQYPPVAFSPGMGAVKCMYKWIGNHLASHGYVVLIFTLPKPFTTKTDQQAAGFVTAFELIEAENQNPESPIYDLVDFYKRGIMGHSMGGVSSLAAAMNMQVDAVVAMAPAPGIAYSVREIEITAPTQIQTGTVDRIVPSRLPKSYYERLITDTKQFLNFNGGNHIQFNDYNMIPFAGQFAVVDTVDYLQRLSRRYATAWLDYYLKDDTSVEPFLFGEYVQQDLESEYLAEMDFVKP